MAPHLIHLASVNDFDQWRAAARALLLASIAPHDVRWIGKATSPDLLGEFEGDLLKPVAGRKVGRVPPRFLKLAQAAVCHSDPERFADLYSVLWRLQKDRRLLLDRDDREVASLYRRCDQVVAEYTRMRDELKFRRAVSADGHKGLAANFSPRHYVLERVAPHFVGTIRYEDWVIMTPYRSAYWDGNELTFGDGRG